MTGCGWVIRVFGLIKCLFGLLCFAIGFCSDHSGAGLRKRWSLGPICVSYMAVSYHFLFCVFLVVAVLVLLL